MIEKAQQQNEKSGGCVLVVDDHRTARESMAETLKQAGHTVSCCSSAAEALNVLEREKFDCIVTDFKMPGMNGVDFIIQHQRRQYGSQMVMVTAHATVSSAVKAMRHGAFDYIEKPFDAERLETLVEQAIRHRQLVSGETQGGVATTDLQAAVMVGSSRPMKLLRERIAQIGPTSETVLITGESGTGKELVAQSIHAASDRNNASLVSLNCPVLSAQLMESELFGHERGAFTGAEGSRSGRFEMAHEGTILLDEITEIDLPLQAKLLRVLQEKSFEKVGSSQTVQVDVRVLATTNRELETEVAEGRFREDLYYRLAVVPLNVPPLRDRRDDIPELTEYFFARCAQRLQREPCTLEPAAEEMLVEYHWPGNVRELENIVTRASVLNLDGLVKADDLRRWLACRSNACGSTAEVEVPLGLSLQEMERKLIEATLEQCGGHRAKTAQALGIGVRTLSGKLRQYGYAPRERNFHAPVDPPHPATGGFCRSPRRKSCRLAVDANNRQSSREPTRGMPCTPKCLQSNGLSGMQCTSRHGSKRPKGRLAHRLQPETRCAAEKHFAIEGQTTNRTMLSGLFQTTTIPVLEQVVNFSQARHNVLAGNIANVDTPGYKARDLSVEDFQQRLGKAIDERSRPPISRSPGEPAREEKPLLAEVADNSRTILRHDKAKVGMEYQVTEMVKNQMQHNLALSVMTSQFRLLQAAISGRA